MTDTLRSKLEDVGDFTSGADIAALSTAISLKRLADHLTEVLADSYMPPPGAAIPVRDFDHVPINQFHAVVRDWRTLIEAMRRIRDIGCGPLQATPSGMLVAVEKIAVEALKNVGS